MAKISRCLSTIQSLLQSQQTSCARVTVTAMSVSKCLYQILSFDKHLPVNTCFLNANIDSNRKNLNENQHRVDFIELKQGIRSEIRKGHPSKGLRAQRFWCVRWRWYSSKIFTTMFPEHLYLIICLCVKPSGILLPKIFSNQLNEWMTLLSTSHEA